MSLCSLSKPSIATHSIPYGRKYKLHGYRLPVLRIGSHDICNQTEINIRGEIVQFPATAKMFPGASYSFILGWLHPPPEARLMVAFQFAIDTVHHAEPYMMKLHGR